MFETGHSSRWTVGITLWILGLCGASRCEPAKLQPVDSARDLFVWTDTCNTYVLRDGDAAILIDLGDGDVLDRLGEIGVRRVEWVLFTHHHREQCQGIAKLASWKARIGAPEAERALLEDPMRFRKAKPSLGDAHTVYGASYVRPPIEPIRLDRTFRDLEVFTWRGRELRCLDTKGNSPGGMSYLLNQDGRWLAFSGDVMLDGARMHTWFDTEWDYGFAKGLYELIGSASLLRSYEPAVLLPSHGQVIMNPAPQLQAYQQKLRTLAKLYVRGYSIDVFAGADQDTVSRPTAIPHVWQVTEHLYKFKRRDFWPNFAILIADSGRALVFDCGLVGRDLLESSLKAMQGQLGLKAIDAVLITHMHGDHFLDVPYLQEKWGTKVWTGKDVAGPCEHPEWYDYAAMIPAYGDGFDSLRIDRKFERGETFEWEGFTFTVDWMPGQTEFGCCIHGRIDGKLVAFTGDNLFGNASDPTQTGHEAVVARNSGIFEEGYIVGADLLRRLQPDLIVGGHSWVIDRPAPMIERFAAWAREIRDAYQNLSAEEDYRYMFDPYWVRAEPYRISVKAGQAAEIVLHLRNFLPRTQSHVIIPSAPKGILAEPAILKGTLDSQSASLFPLRLTVASDLKHGVYIVAFDVTRDGKRHGQWFDLILSVEP
ncbi:MAG TPA: MBL fold metallo-hydrolase [Sedimentisphaerales bacterium]|nr:MBL fold metallo-hydrolase [Sedimentisphaerales bacterium]